MPQSYVALITPLSEGPPGGQIDNSLPGFGQGGGSGHHPSQPIHHPGHPDHGKPVDPSFGQGGRPHPGNRPPGSGGGGQIDNALPEGEPIPPDQIDNELPDPPEAYADKVVVAIKKPNEPWKYVAYETDSFPDNELPSAPVHPGNRPPGAPRPPQVGGGPAPPPPVHPGNRPPGQGAPPRPGTPLPPAAGPKPVPPRPGQPAPAPTRR